ncbi:hypothetical protein, variant 2 [Phytophthora nicotianae]|uniref:BZIP domain-containing protein n=2 Tax=Phytophthora nicotianae TaxID=4792 RepID=W2KTK6_PHYNI|nr:hypothetical protein, variant 2 [Phytophthora nicotianae]
MRAGVDYSDAKHSADVELRRQRNRMHQARYKMKQRQLVADLEAAVTHLRQEIQELEIQQRLLSYGLPTTTTIWNIAAEYFRLFRHGTKGSTMVENAHIEPALNLLHSQVQWDFMKTTMAPDVTDGVVIGIDALIESHALQSRCYEAIDLQPLRMDDGPEGLLIVSTQCELTITENMLVCGFPNLVKDGEWSSLADKMLGKKIVIYGSTHFFWDNTRGRVVRLQWKADVMTALLRLLGSLDTVPQVFNGARMSPEGMVKRSLMIVTHESSVLHHLVFYIGTRIMSSEVPFFELEDAQSVLRDVLAFIETCEDANASPTSVQLSNRDRDKKKRARNYSPDYERSRREKKKAERDALRCQVDQYTTQLELLRTQKTTQRDESKWGWVHAATQEEEKRQKAEDLNHQLRGLLVQQFNVAQTFKNLLTQEAGFATLVQSVLSSCPPCSSPTKLSTFSTFSSITSHLKGLFGQLCDSSDYVFDSTSIFFDANSLVCAANLKYQDPISGPCIELLSSTPLPCNMENAASMLWEMMLAKEVFGPNSGCYTIKQQTESSAEWGYSVRFNGPEASGAVDGVTLMEKFDKAGQTLIVWTSMMVESDGNPYFTSQGWVSVKKLPSNPDGEAFVRICSRLAGLHLGVRCDGDKVDVPVARKHQFMAKSRQEHVQLKILERAELQKSVL